jgi:hypothetical protein
LLLGTCKISHFAFLKSLFRRDYFGQEYTHDQPGNLMEYGFSSWEQSYPCEVFAGAASRLHSFELPLEWMEDRHLKQFTPTIHDVRAFKSLRHISIPHNALWDFVQFEHPNYVFSATLERLTINITYTDPTWSNVAVPPILWHLFRSKARFPKLRKITLVYHHDFVCHNPSLIERAKKVGIELVITVENPSYVMAALHNPSSKLYNYYETSLMPTALDFRMYGPRGCYGELSHLLGVAEQEQTQRRLEEQERRKIPPGVRGAAKRELIAANWRQRG